MSAVYSKAPADVAERAKPLVEKNHFELHQHGLKIDLIFANSSVDDEGQPTGPAVSHGGYPALAVARNLSTKDRVMGRGDCEIVIDADRWPLLSDEEKDALLDHELQFQELCYCDAGGQYYLPHIGLNGNSHESVKQTIASARKSLYAPVEA